MLTLQLLFAGIWSQIWHWGTGIGIIVILLAMAYFTTAIPFIGPWLGNARKDLLWAAFGVGLLLTGEAIGAHDQAKKSDAKKIVIEQHVDKVVKKAKTPRARAAKDRWDRPEY